jgi:hypothetical protein
VLLLFPRRRICIRLASPVPPKGDQPLGSDMKGDAALIKFSLGNGCPGKALSNLQVN